VDDGRTGLVVLGLGDPHLLEGGEGGEDGTTDPDRVLSLRGGDDLDLHGGGSEGSELLGHSLADSGKHGGSSRHDDVGVQVASDIDITLHDGLKGAVMDTGGFLSDEGGLEENLRASESLVSDNDDVSIGKLVGLLKSRGLSSSLHLLVKVKSNEGELLLNITDDFTLSSCGEGVTTLSEDLHQVLGQVAASKIQTHNGVGKSITFIDGDSVGDTITRVQHATSGTTGGIQRKHSLNVDIHGRDVEGLEHDLSHTLSVGLGVEGSLSQQDRVFLRSNTKLVVEGVMPDLLHVIPVGHNTVLDGVLQGEDTSLGLSLITNVGILLIHTNHDTRVLRSSNNGGKHSARSIITGETSLAHTGPVVHN